MALSISQSLKQEVESEISRVLPEVIAFRHERHAAPELTWREENTAKAVAQELKKIPGLNVQEGVGRLGVVAVLKGDKPGPTVALRADMDALPIQEETQLSYRSAHQGVMHACGHDGHMANLMGCVWVLHKLRRHLQGTVKFIFQPAEEGGAGADAMCKDGALENPKVDVIFGLHGWPEAPAAKVFVKSGPMLATTAEVRIKVQGVGCHAALPHLGTDQILAASRIVDALQSVVAREVYAHDAVVLTITKFHGGSAINVIPPTVELGGTLRTLSKESRNRVEASMRRVIKGVADSQGVTADLQIIPGYPPTFNHEGPTSFIEDVARQILPKDALQRLAAPSMGGEDFAFFLERIPGCYFFLGMDDGRTGGYPSLHHPQFDFNDQALPVGMAMMIHAALGYAGAVSNL